MCSTFDKPLRSASSICVTHIFPSYFDNFQELIKPMFNTTSALKASLQNGAENHTVSNNTAIECEHKNV